MKNKLLIAAIAVILLALMADAVRRELVSKPEASGMITRMAPAVAPVDEGAFERVPMTFYGDAFRLPGGRAGLQGHAWSATSTPLVPMSYTLAATATGELGGVDGPGAVAAVYRGFGANLQWTTLFVFRNRDGVLEQAASGVAYQGDAKIDSVSLDGGIVTLRLLTVSEADAQLPHYAQTPSRPTTLLFEISGDELIPFAPHD